MISIVASRILVAAPFVLLFVGTYVVFVLIEPGQRVDAAAFSAMTPLYEQVGGASVTLRVLLPLAATACVAAAIIAAVFRGRWREGVTAAAATAVVAVLASVLKESVLSRPYHGDFVYTENTFPSGHTAIAIVAAACCVWLFPSRRRRVTALIMLSLLGIAASVVQLTSYAHRFSDVVGGIMLSGAVVAACIAGPGVLRSRSVLAMYALLALTTAGSVGLVAAWSVNGQSAAFSDVAVALVVATVAAAVAAVMMIPLASGSRHGR